jgi:HD-like signal output (HDOD) protein
VLGRSHRAQVSLAIHFTAPDQSKTFIGETLDVSSTGFSVQVRTEGPLPSIILAGILPADIPGDAIVCKAQLVWRGGVVRGLKRASYRITSIAHRSQERLDQLIQASIGGLVRELRGFSLLADCAEADLATLLGLARTREIAAGRTLYESSAGHAGIYVLLSGEVAVASRDAGTVHLGPGGVAGRWPGAPVSDLTVTAVSDVRLLYVSPAIASEALERIPDLVARLRDERAGAAPAATAERPVRAHLPRELLEIPTPPPLLRRLLDGLTDPGLSVSGLTTILGPEPGLADLLQRTLGEPPLGPATPPAGLGQLAERLGLRPTVSLAILAVLCRTLRDESSREEAMPVWAHCLATAHFAEEIGGHLPAADAAGEREVPLCRERLFVEGVLHDVGMIVLLQKFPGHFVRLRGAIPRCGSLEAAERELHEVGHAELGYRVAKAWQLPEPIPLTIAAHHDPHLWVRVTRDPPELAARLRRHPNLAVISLADLLARRSDIGVEFDARPPELPAALHESLGLSGSTVLAIAGRAPIVRARTEALLRGFLA